MDFPIFGDFLHAKNFRKILGPNKPEGYRERFTAVLHLDDDVTISVKIAGLVVGRLFSTDAWEFRNYLDRKNALAGLFDTDTILVDCEVTGGGTEGINEYFNVLLHIDEVDDGDYIIHHSGEYDEKTYRTAVAIERRGCIIPVVVLLFIVVLGLVVSALDAYWLAKH